MESAKEAKIFRVHISEDDRHDGKPLYEVLVQRCRELGIAGATVFRGLEGYGETAQIHRRHMIGSDRPIVVMAVDSAENIARLAADLEAMIESGLIAISDGKMLRIQQTASR